MRTINHNQKVALVVSKSVSATLSLIASSIVVYKIYARYKSQGTSSARISKTDGMTTYYRMLLSISIIDIVHSFSAAFSTLAVPRYTNGTFAFGNTATCTIQGALQQLTPTIVLYMATLNTYFMLKIRYNVPDHIIQSRYEFWFHAIPITNFLGTTITGLSMRVFGPLMLTELGCWLDSYCIITNTCTRSGPIFYNHLDYFAWSFAYIWLFVALLVVIVNSIMIYTAIRKQEKRNTKYMGAILMAQKSEEAQFNQSSILQSHENISSEFFVSAMKKEVNPKDIHLASNINEIKATTSMDDEEKHDMKKIDETEESCDEDVAPYTDQSSRIQWTEDVGGSPGKLASRTRRVSLHHGSPTRQSRTAAVQSLLYVTSALFTTVWILMPWVGYKLQVDASARFFFALMVNIVSPSQGMFNLIIFVRLHFLRLRETKKDWSLWRCIKTCLFSVE